MKPDQKYINIFHILALKAFRGEKHDIKNDIAEMQEEQRQMEIEPAWTMRQLLKSKKLRFPLIILAFLQTSQQCSGINVVSKSDEF